MTEFIEVTFEHLMNDLNARGSEIETRLRGYEESGSKGDYTVCWPKGSVRVIRGADYGTARTVACILRDERTQWMNQPTTFVEPVIARIRRPLNDRTRVTSPEAFKSTVYTKDRLLGGDFFAAGSLDLKFTDLDFPRWRFDYSSLPEG